MTFIHLIIGVLMVVGSLGIIAAMALDALEPEDGYAQEEKAGDQLAILGMGVVLLMAGFLIFGAQEDNPSSEDLLQHSTDFTGTS